MNDARAPSPATPPRRRRGLKTLLVLVAASALVVRAGLMVRDELRPSGEHLRALRSTDVEGRRAAAQYLLALGPDEVGAAIPQLIAALGDRDEVVRRNVMAALGWAVTTAAPDPANRPEVRAGVRALIEALDDPAESVRHDAVLLLAADLGGGIGDPAVLAASLARAALERRSPRVRAAAATSLSRFAAGSPLSPPGELAATLADPAAPGEVRGVAAVVLAAFPAGRAGAVGPLVAALGDPDPAVRRGAAAGLALLDPLALRPIVPALLAAAAGPIDPPVAGPPAGVAIRSLAPGAVEFRDLTAAGRLDGTQDDPPGRAWDPVPMAAVALARAASVAPPDDRAVAGLARLLGAASRWHRAAAAATLAGLGPKAYAAGPALAEAVDREVREIRMVREALQVREVSERYPGGPYVPAPMLLPDLCSGLANVAPGGPFAPAAVAAIAPVLDLRDWNDQIVAIRALGRFGPEAAPAMPRLLEATPHSRKEPTVAAAIRRIEARPTGAESDPGPRPRP